MGAFIRRSTGVRSESLTVPAPLRDAWNRGNDLPTACHGRNNLGGHAMNVRPASGALDDDRRCRCDGRRPEGRGQFPTPNVRICNDDASAREQALTCFPRGDGMSIRNPARVEPVTVRRLEMLICLDQHVAVPVRQNAPQRGLATTGQSAQDDAAPRAKHRRSASNHLAGFRTQFHAPDYRMQTLAVGRSPNPCVAQTLPNFQPSAK